MKNRNTKYKMILLFSFLGSSADQSSEVVRQYHPATLGLAFHQSCHSLLAGTWSVAADVLAPAFVPSCPSAVWWPFFHFFDNIWHMHACTLTTLTTIFDGTWKISCQKGLNNGYAQPLIVIAAQWKLFNE